MIPAASSSSLLSSMRGRPRVRVVVAAAVAAVVPILSQGVRGETWVGNGADSSWSTAANWSTNAAPANNGTAAIVFSGTNKLTPVVNAPYSINSLAFSTTAGAFSLSGSTLTIGAGGITDASANAETVGDAVTLGAAQTWLTSAGSLAVSGNVSNGGNLLTVDGTAATTVSGVISGTGGLTKTGTGTLTLTGTAANTFTGLTTVSAGTLTLNKSPGVAALSGNVNITGGTLSILQPSNVGSESVISVSGGSLALPANPVIGGLLYHSGALTWGGGPITLTGTSANVLSVSGGFSTLGFSFNLTGATGGGITNADATAATLSGAINFGGTTRSVTVNDNAASDDLVLSGVISNGALTKDGAGTLFLAGANTYTGVTTLDQGTLRVNADSALGATSSTLTFNGGTLQASGGFSTPRAVSVTASGGTVSVTNLPLTFAGSLTGTGGLTKTGTGTLVIGGGPTDTSPNAYSGTLTVSGGTVNFDKAANTQAIGGDLVISGGSTTVNFLAGGLLSPSANVTMNPSVVHFGDTNTFGSFSMLGAAFNYSINGTMTLTSTGTALTLSSPAFGGITMFNPFHFTGATGGSISVSSNNGYTLNGAIDLGGVTRMVSVLKGPFTINNVISNGGITKTGSGSLKLGGGSANTYTGPTTVSQGLLQLDNTGGVAVPGSLAINSGGTVTLLAAEQVAPTSGVTVTGGTLDLNGFAQTLQAPVTLSGGTITGGTLNLASDVSVPPQSGQSTISSNVNLAPGTHTINVTQASLDGATTLMLPGVVSGAGGLLFTGTGMGGGNVHFTGTASNTFTGGATVQSYVFLDNAPGTVALPGPVTVGGGATVGDLIINADNAIATNASLSVLAGGLVQIGTTGNYSQTLASFNIDGYVQGGTLVLAPGGTGTIGPDAFIVANTNLVNDGTLTLAGPKFNGRLQNNGTLILSADLNMTSGGAGLTNAGSLTLPLGRTFSSPGAGLLNPGTLALAGGTASANYVQNDNTLTGFGTVSGYNFFNNGYVSAAGGALVLAANTTNTGNIDVQSNGQLQLSNPLTNSGAITLLGGSVTSPSTTPATLTNAGLLLGRGSISAPLANTGTLQPQGGSLNLTQALTNNGMIQLTPGSSLLGGAIANANTIQGAGTVANPVTNAGTIEPTGGTLNLTALLTNGAGGLIRVAAGNKLLAQNFPTNAGSVLLTGGTLDTAGHPLTNTGTISSAGGTSTIAAPLTNAGGGKIILSANTTAVFTQPLTLQSGSEFRIAAGSAASFLAPVTGVATFTGSGAKFFEAGASAPSALDTAGVGSTTVDSPASLATGYLNESSLIAYGPVTLAPNSLSSTLSTLDLSTTGSLDLSNDALRLTGTAVSALRGDLLDHQLFSSLSDSTHALGYVPGLLVKLTLIGDANLDGVLNADDYALLDKGFRTAGSTWWNGDFNYDGSVTPADYLLIDTTYLSLHPSDAGALLAGRESQFGADYVAQLIAAVPEPGLSLAWLLLPLSSLASRRRSRGARRSAVPD